MNRDEQGWIEEYKKKQAFWMHDGNPKRPHALLTSGSHSRGFFNSRLIISDEDLLRQAVSDLIELYMEEGHGFKLIDCVVGPQTGATKMAEFVSYEVSKYHTKPRKWASPSKLSDGGVVKSMVFDDSGGTIKPDEVVFLCEDVISTGNSIDLTVKAVIDAGGLVLPFIMTLVNRSGLPKLNDRLIFGLINRYMPMWTPEECPLCKKGSEPIRPKDNWDKLNAIY